MSKLNRLEAYLKSGNTVTPKQITAMFNLKNPTAAIHSLRSAGVCVYGNPSTLYDGTRTTKYKVGAPTKAMIRAAHQLGLFA